MESIKFAELTTAAFELNRSLLHFKRAQTDCEIAELKLYLAQASEQLAITQLQQAQLTLITARSRSLVFTTNNTDEVTN